MLIKNDKQGYLSHFASELLDSMKYDSTQGAPQYELNIFATMTTYRVPDLSDLKAFLATISISY